MAQASGALVTAAGTREQEKQKNTVFHINDCVKIKGTNSTGVIEDIKGKDAMIIMGDIHTRIPLSRIEPSSQTHNDTPAQPSAVINRMTREVIDQHRAQFYPDIDVRGMRGDEALLKVQHFVDDSQALQEIQGLIGDIGDLERIISRAAAGKILPREVMQLHRGLSRIVPVRQLCSGKGVEALDRMMDRMTKSRMQI